MENDGESPESPVVLMMEEFTLDADLRDALFTGFLNLIEREVKPPPETWSFDADEKSSLLEDQFSVIQGDRIVMAIHDLNLPKTQDPQQARRFIEDKFIASEARVRNAELRIGRPPLKLFRSMIVYEHVGELPWVHYPSKRFERWYLLPFVRIGGKGRPAPEPSYAEIFRSYLRAWFRDSREIQN
jgi:hypothetical protein